MHEVVITAAARTAIGAFQGAFAALDAPRLGGAAIRAAVDRCGVVPVRIEEVIMGCVLSAGQGQAPARQAGFHAGLGDSVPATTLNKLCGSGMKAVMLAHDQIALGAAGVIVAGGMESMTNAPYLLPRMRGGARLGHAQALDHMLIDGLEDAYDPGRPMGSFAEDCAAAFGFTREAQDAYALASLRRAMHAQADGAFAAEIVPVPAQTRRTEIEVAADEQPARAHPEGTLRLKPALRPDGAVTAVNASSISDGAAALVLASARVAAEEALPIRARILGHASHAQAPADFPTASAPAVRKLLSRLGWTPGDVDLWEVNETFAVVPMAFMHDLGVPHAHLNVNGGACALGHPIGASGARILVTLLHALESRGLRRGIAAVCIGGGEATAIAIERP